MNATSAASASGLPALAAAMTVAPVALAVLAAATVSFVVPVYEASTTREPGPMSAGTEVLSSSLCSWKAGNDAFCWSR